MNRLMAMAGLLTLVCAGILVSCSDRAENTNEAPKAAIMELIVGESPMGFTWRRSPANCTFNEVSQGLYQVDCSVDDPDRRYRLLVNLNSSKVTPADPRTRSKWELFESGIEIMTQTASR